MSEVRLERVTKAYGGVVAVDALSLVVREGEFVTLLGPSGCGKTTTLRMVAGFVAPTEGDIWIGGRSVARVPPNRRNTGMVFQSFALFPHLSVADNVGFGLRVRGIRGAEAERRVREALALVHLEDLARRLPRELSGGQQQRVALARAVVIRPEVLLLDEPLSSLDLKLRQELQGHIKHVQQMLGVTTLYVTHDQGEALRLSDRVAVMNKGRILQLDAPTELYQHPRNAFVANFVGATNLIAVEVVDGGGETGVHRVRRLGSCGQEFRVAARPGDGGYASGQEMLLGFRPEVVALGGRHENGLTARVEKTSYSGAIWSLAAVDAEGQRFDIDVPYNWPAPAAGESVSFTWRSKDCFLVPKDA